MKRIHYLIMLLVITAVLACSCTQNSQTSEPNQTYTPDESYQKASDDPSLGAAYDEEAPEGEAGGVSAGKVSQKGTEGTENDQQETAASQKLVYTSNVTLETKTYDETLTALRKSIKQVKGIVESEQESNNNASWDDLGRIVTGNRSNYMTIRVPAESYEDFLAGIDELGIVTDKQSDVQNITRQYNNTSTQIKALEIQEKRLLAMLDKASTIEDMITVEKRLTEVQTELNQAKNNLSAMDTDVTYSTVHLTIREVEKVSRVDKPSFGQRVREAIEDSGEKFVAIMQGTCIALIYLLPNLVVLALFVALILFIIRFFRKSSRKRKAKKALKKAAADSATRQEDPVSEENPDLEETESQEGKEEV